MAMLQLNRVRYGKPAKNAPVSQGSKLGASMSPNPASVPKPDPDKPMPQEGTEDDGLELLDDGVVHIRHDAIQTVSEKRFGDKVCSEVMLNSGDTLLLKQYMSEVSRMITVAG